MAKLWVIQVHNGVTHSNPHDLLRKEKKVKNKRSEKKEVVAQSSNQQQELITNIDRQSCHLQSRNQWSTIRQFEKVATIHKKKI